MQGNNEVAAICCLCEESNGVVFFKYSNASLAAMRGAVASGCVSKHVSRALSTPASAWAFSLLYCNLSYRPITPHTLVFQHYVP